MDPKSGNPGSGGATGDLWKKVLEEVQSEAAARRAKVGAKSAAAPKASNLELDLLKRILHAIESRPAAPTPVDHGELLHQILDAVRSPRETDPQAIVSPILAALERADHDERLKLLEHRLTAQLESLIRSQPQPQAIDPAQAIEALGQSIRSQLEEHAAKQPVIDPQAVVTPIVEALAKQDVHGAIESLRDDLTQRLDQVTAQSPKPVDVTPQLDALRQAIESQPRPQAVDVDALITRISALLDERKPADVTAALDAIRQSIESQPKQQAVDVDALITRITGLLDERKPADVTATLDAIRQTLETQPKAQGVDVDALITRIASLLDERKPADLGASLDALRRSIEAQPKPIDVTAKLDEILAAAKSKPDDGRDAVLLQILELVQQQAARPAATDPGDKLTAILEAVSSLPRLDIEAIAAKVRESLPPPVAPPQMPEPSQPVDPTPALRAMLEERHAQSQEDLASLREALAQEITRQTGLVREEMLAQSIELIDQVKAQPAGVSPQHLESLRGELLGAVGKEIAAGLTALPRSGEALAALTAKLESIERALAQQPRPQAIDEAALALRLREAVPPPAMLDVDALAAKLRESMPAPQPVKLPVMPSHEADFAKQQMMLADLTELVKRQAGGDARQQEQLREAKVLREQLEALIREQRQAQQQQERTIAAMSGDLASRLEAKINSGLAKIELAAATADGGRPAPLTSDEPAPAVSSYRYSWMNQQAPRQRTPAVAMTVTAVAAVGMFLVLLINALSGNGRTAPPADPPPANPLASGAGPSTSPVTPRNPTGGETPKTPATSVTPTGTTPTDPVTPTGPLFPKPTGGGDGPLVAAPIVDELRHLTNPSSPRPRAVYELTQAKQVVFLIHISGKSPATMATLVAQLKKSMSQLTPTQQFAVVFSEGNRFVEAPPTGLRAGSEEQRSRVENWIDLNIRAASHRPAASPLVAMDVAISYQPDLLWILSDAIVTDEPGRVSSKEIIERIAALNADGTIRIAATQVGPADAAATLRTLAEKYGGAYITVGDAASASIAP